MHKILLFFFGLFFSFSCYSQGFVNAPRKKVIKTVSKYYSDNSINTRIEQMDSGVIFFIRDPKVQDLTIQFKFDKSAKCYSERYLLSCDSCYKKLLNGVLGKERFRWVKVNEQTYYSKLPYRLMLVIEPEGSFAYAIQRSLLSRRDHKRMVDTGK